MTWSVGTLVDYAAMAQHLTIKIDCSVFKEEDGVKFPEEHG